MTPNQFDQLRLGDVICHHVSPVHRESYWVAVDRIDDHLVVRCVYDPVPSYIGVIWNLFRGGSYIPDFTKVSS